MRIEKTNRWLDQLISSFLFFLLILKPNLMSSSTISSFLNPRYVVQKVLSRPQREGVDAIIRRSIGRWVIVLSILLDSRNVVFWFGLFISYRPELRNLDPFLMLDEIKGMLFFYFDIMDWEEEPRNLLSYFFKDSSPKGGFPDHPHRGFETVTYMFQVI